MAATTVTAASSGLTLRKIPVAALIGGGLAAVINALLWLVLSLVGVTIQVATPDGQVMDLMVAFVIGASFIPAIGAGVLLAILGRFTKNPVQIFQIIAVVFLLLSFASPLGLPVSITSKIALELMHLIAGVAITWALSTQTKSA